MRTPLDDGGVEGGLPACSQGVVERISARLAAATAASAAAAFRLVEPLHGNVLSFLGRATAPTKVGRIMGVAAMK